VPVASAVPSNHETLMLSDAKLQNLFHNNRLWASRQIAKDPGHFERLALRQKPEYLWIGCSDSRVPANEIVDLPPGDLFVHRNIANVVVHSDFNCLSVMQFAVDVLKVKHIMVVGHYGCSGVAAACHNTRIGLADNWLRHIREIREHYAERINALATEKAREDRLCELNVIEQATNVCQATVVQDAWARGQELAVHGWIYGLRDGLLRDLQITVTAHDQLAAAHKKALESLFENPSA
jgi:carbonic anhydrase